ncbi:MAG: 30S ribosomal protein S16 [Bacteroidota bacterium]|nr:30S ribosomal protein S16 [Bacteroidota bacterium]MDP4194411.1 30S ribosomal protein S16 [Bacteroidota bacterium]
MAVKLRLRRMGKKRQPIYKVVAADSRAPRDGKILEAIGLYNPKTDPATIDIKEDRALYWLGVGAQPTDTVRNILSKKGILLRKELLGQGLSEAEVESKMGAWLNLNEAKVSSSKKNADAKKEGKASATAKEQPKEVIAEEVKGTTSNENQG